MWGVSPQDIAASVFQKHSPPTVTAEGVHKTVEQISACMPMSEGHSHLNCSMMVLALAVLHLPIQAGVRHLCHQPNLSSEFCARAFPFGVTGGLFCV